MRLLKILTALAAAAVFVTTGAYAANGADFSDGVNWKSKAIQVTGVGIAPPNSISRAQAEGLAFTAAKADAYRKAAEVINGVRVEGETTVEKMQTTQDSIRLRVDATIKGAKIIDKNFFSDGSYRVTVQVPLFGASNSLASAVFERTSTIEPFPDPVFEVEPSNSSGSSRSYNPAPYTPAVNPYKPPLSKMSTATLGNANLQKLAEDSLTVTDPIYQPTPTDNSQVAYETPNATLRQPVKKSVEEYASMAEGDYTGLIVDCRGLDLQPVMSPVIKNINGTKIYGHKNLDIDKIIEMGMADYVDNTEKVARAGEKPLVIKAQALDNFNSNPVVDIPDSNRILIENHASKFLKDLKVVFLFD